MSVAVKRYRITLALSCLFLLAVLIPLRSWAESPPPDRSAAPLVDNPLWRIGGSLEALAVQGDYAYLAQGTALRVVDLRTFQSVGSLSFRYPARDVAVQGAYAYVVTNGYGDLHVVDVSDPAGPQLTGRGEVPGWFGGESVVVRGDYAYVLAAGTDGLVTFDISTPTAPTLVGQIKGVSGRWLRSGAQHLYLLAWNRLIAFDLEAPASPAQRGELPLNNAGNLAVVEPYVYITDFTSDESGPGLGLVVADVTDPDNPATADTWVYYGEHTGAVLGVAAAGNYAYVGYNDNAGTYSAIYVVNVSNPAEVQFVKKLEPLGSFYNLLVEGSWLYVAGGPDGDLLQVSIADPSNPSLGSDLRLPGTAEIVRWHGDRAYVVARGDYYGTHDSIWIYDVSRPAAPAVVAREDPYVAGISDLQVDDAYLYVCGPYAGLSILDSSDLHQVGRYHPDDASAYCGAAAVNGDAAYVVHAAGGALTDTLDVLDVSHPEAPGYVSTVTETGQRIEQAVLDGSRLYLTDWDNAVVVYDTSSPLAPRWAARYALPGLRTLFPHGNILYAGVTEGGSNRLELLDVGDLRDIRVLGTFPTLNAVASIDVQGNVAYVGSANATYAVDVSDPAAPQALWEQGGPAEGLDIEASPPFVLVADGALGTTLHATADGAVRPAGGTGLVFPGSPLVVTFAQAMDTASVQFSCTPDPGGWVAHWETVGYTAQATGRVLTLTHAPFQENEGYSFQVTSGRTADGTLIESFGLEFSVIETQTIFLPLLMYNP